MYFLFYINSLCVLNLFNFYPNFYLLTIISLDQARWQHPLLTQYSWHRLAVTDIVATTSALPSLLWRRELLTELALWSVLTSPSCSCNTLQRLSSVTDEAATAAPAAHTSPLWRRRPRPHGPRGLPCHASEPRRAAHPPTQVLGQLSQVRSQAAP